MSRLLREAPLVDLRFEPYGGDVLRRLESGALDLAFALATTPLPPGAVSETVACDELALILRRGHRAAKRRWKLEDYSRFDHVGVALLGDGAVRDRRHARGVRRVAPHGLHRAPFHDRARLRRGDGYGDDTLGHICAPLRGLLRTYFAEASFPEYLTADDPCFLSGSGHGPSGKMVLRARARRGEESLCKRNPRSKAVENAPLNARTSSDSVTPRHANCHAVGGRRCKELHAALRDRVERVIVSWRQRSPSARLSI